MSGRFLLKWCLLGGLLIVLGADAGAQSFGRARQSTFGQEVPPFLREAPPAQRVVVEGKERPIPRFGSPGNPRFYNRLMFPLRTDFLTDYVSVMQLNLPLPYTYLDNFGDAPNAMPVLNGLRTPADNFRPFNFRQAAPHLAFFCRLEINEAANYVIPAKFRLGGHRYWQDELPKRE
jgi:hypothetical protein